MLNHCLSLYSKFFFNFSFWERDSSIKLVKGIDRILLYNPIFKIYVLFLSKLIHYWCFHASLRKQPVNIELQCDLDIITIAKSVFSWISDSDQSLSGILWETFILSTLTSLFIQTKLYHLWLYSYRFFSFHSSNTFWFPIASPIYKRIAILQ